MKMFEFFKNKYAKAGFWGTIIAVLCCFTPILVWIFAAVGLAAYTAYLDYILLPALFLFLALLGYGYLKHKKTTQK